MEQTSPYKIYIEKEIPLIENLLKYYRKSDGAIRKCESESEEKSDESARSRSHTRSVFRTPNGQKLQPTEVASHDLLR